MRRLNLTENEYELLVYRLTSDRCRWFSWALEDGIRQDLLEKVLDAKEAPSRS